jgi:hypothetical protein
MSNGARSGRPRGMNQYRGAISLTWTGTNNQHFKRCQVKHLPCSQISSLGPLHRTIFSFPPFLNTPIRVIPLAWTHTWSGSSSATAVSAVMHLLAQRPCTMAIGVSGGSKTLKGFRHLPVIVILGDDGVKHTSGELVESVQHDVGCPINISQGV